MKTTDFKRFIMRFVAVTSAVCLVLCCFSQYVFAAESPAYTEVLAQEPKYVADVAFDEIYDFYSASSTDEITDPKTNNYAYGLVTVNGAQINCHVYRRTFNITDVGRYTVSEINSMLPKIIPGVRTAISTKYLKCIAKSYSVNVTGNKDSAGEFTSLIVRVLIATGEKTEDRAALIENYVKPNAEGLQALGTLDRFVSLNEFMLDGRFSYDTELYNRSSAVAFVADGKGVCEEYAALTSLFLDELGYENIIITGVDSEGVRHMWNMVCADGRWYHLDILWDGPIDENGKHTEVNKTHLLVSTDTMSATHTPDSLYDDYCKLAVYDYVFDNLPQNIRGTTTYHGTEYFSGVPTLTTVAQLRQSTQLYNFLVITDAEGKALGEDAYVGTGCVITLNVNGIVLESHVICVKSDVDGDGRITETDIARIAAYRIGADGVYPDTFFLAADRNQDGMVTVTDLIIAYDVMKGTYIEPSGPDDKPEDTTAANETESPDNAEGVTEPIE